MGMKINRLCVSNFMAFNDLDIEFSDNINIISSENSTGKTALIKLLYTSLKTCSKAYSSNNTLSKEELESAMVSKFQGIFMPDNGAIGRLVNRHRGNNSTDVRIFLSNKDDIRFGFSNKHSKHIDIKHMGIKGKDNFTPVYIPPKEIISSTENFGSLYDEFHIAFEETYYDLCRLLERPLRKGPNTIEQNMVMKSFEDIVNGSIVQKDKKFYLKVKGQGEFEMGLVSEGYRKMATIMYLILSGSLTKDSILFWDEPETNMNPKMIKPMCDALTELAKMGVQIFVATHNYFVQQYFNMEAIYNKDSKIKYNFISLYRNSDSGEINAQCVDNLDDMTENAIMKEFDDLYDREQRFIFGD